MNKRCATYARLWPEFVAGGLGWLTRRRLAGHLRDCPRCREEVAALAKVEEAIRGLPQADPGPEFWEAFNRELHLQLAQLHQQSETPAPRPLRRYLYWAAPVLTALLLWATAPLFRTLPPGTPEPLGPPVPRVFQEKTELEGMTKALPQADLAPREAPAPLVAAAKPAAAPPPRPRAFRVEEDWGPLEAADPLWGPAPEDLLAGLSPEEVDQVFEKLQQRGGY